MRRKPQLRNGLKLAPRTPGNLLSGAQMDLLVQLFNAVTSGRVEYGSTLGYRITDNNLLITLPRTAAGGDGSDITLQTNGVDNTVQTLLNLIAGSGITLTANGAGGVTIAASGTSSAVKMVLVAVWHEVLECTYQGQTVYVLKSPKLRNSIASETINGVAYSYSYGASHVARSSNGGGTVESQVVTPPWLTNDEIWAQPITAETRIKIPGSTPINVSAAFIDTNRDGRAWSKETTL
jgi:hypothetical protein